MLIGIPKEIKNNEFRVGMTPAGVYEFVVNGHQVIVEKNAGTGIGFSDQMYREAGAEIVEHSGDIFKRAQLIIKVKEPQPQECKQLTPDHTLFTYLHLAPDPDQANRLMQSGATCIAYETVTHPGGGLPLLAPMSEVAGRLSVQVGAHHLEKPQGGIGCLLGGVPGVAAAKVTIIGGGVVGTHAAIIALGMGADVTILDKSLPRLRQLDSEFGGRLHTVYSTTKAIEDNVMQAQLVIGAVLIPGAAAPKLVTREMLKKMQAGTVIVDVAIDQGGCFATSKATTHAQPTYVVDGVVHCCIANLPSGVARTATMSLTNATLPYALSLANKGTKVALKENKEFLNGLNVCSGAITHPAVAESIGCTYTPPLEALGD